MIKIRKMARLMCSAYVCFFVLLFGFMLIGELCYAAEPDVVAAFNPFATSLLKVLEVVFGKVLAAIMLVAAGFQAGTGKYGQAAGCVLACLIFAFIPTIVGLLFKAM